MIKQPSNEEILRAQEEAILDASDLVWNVINDTGRTKAWVAKQLGMTSVQLSLVLQGYTELNIRMLATIAARMNKRLVIDLVDIE